MATNNKNYGRRACTEVPDANNCEAFDLNNLPDNNEEAPAAIPEDVDDIDF